MSARNRCGHVCVQSTMPAERDDPRAFVCVSLTGPRGGYIGDTLITRANAQRLVNELQARLDADAVAQLKAVADDLGVFEAPLAACGERLSPGRRSAEPGFSAALEAANSRWRI